jgi:hypothetical protein
MLRIGLVRRASKILSSLGEGPRLTLLRAGLALREGDRDRASTLLAQVPERADEPLEIARLRTQLANSGVR